MKHHDGLSSRSLPTCSLLLEAAAPRWRGPRGGLIRSLVRACSARAAGRVLLRCLLWSRTAGCRPLVQVDAATMPRRSARSPPKVRAQTLPPGLGFSPRQPRAVSPESRKVVPEAPLPPSPPRKGALPCMAYVVGYHACGLAALCWLHAKAYGVVSPVHCLLAMFCVTNAWICICETSLLVYCDEIKREHASYAAAYGVGVLPPVFLLERVAVHELFQLKYWARMWSQYSTLDASYADTASFGFCVDVSNGISTFVPTVLFAVGMSVPILPARWLGMMGLIEFYKMFYGTVIYFFQYAFNRRFERTPRAVVWGIVVPANGYWIVLPLLGIWVSSRLILHGDFGVLQAGWPL